MGRRAWILAGLLALITTPASAAARGPRHPSTLRLRPHAFASCAELVGYARRHFAATHGVPERPLVALREPVASGRPGVGAPAPKAAAPATPPAAPSSSAGFSTTNNQESGVDEPDLVKTDGATIFSVSQGRVHAVSVGASGPRLAGSLDLGASGYGAQLLLRGSHLIVISGGGSYGVGAAGSAPPGGRPRSTPRLASLPPSYYYGASTVITEIDVSDPAAMRVTRTMTVDGTFVAARQNGSTARIVISSTPRAIYDAGVRGRASAWVPMQHFRSALSGRHYARAVSSCTAVRHPVQFSGLGMLTILTINLDRGLWAASSAELMADAQVVYGSTGSLYVATQRWIGPQMPLGRLPSQTTVIDRFDASKPDTTTLLSSGEVPGYLLNQFSLSEYRGYLRAATTSRPIWWGAGPPRAVSQSFVTVLADRGTPLLAPVGQVSGLGTGQQIQSVRFVGDTGYVVTFRQVDPLYVIDLSSAAAPRRVGQLELSGYSAYLHPIGPGLLLGIGVDVGSSNEPSGTQIELFDVSEPSLPRLLARATLGDGSSSEVTYDAHAFLFWPPTKLAVLPIQTYAPPQGSPGPPTQPAAPGSTSSGASGQDFVGAVGFEVSPSGIVERGRISHDAVNGYPPQIRRSIVIGKRLFTLSDAGVLASDLDTLARESFIAF